MLKVKQLLTLFLLVVSCAQTLLVCAETNDQHLTNASIITQEDELGNVIYTNISPTSDIPEEPKSDLSVQTSPAVTAITSKVKNSSVSKFRIPPELQAGRDDKRRTILLSELEQEQQALILSQSKNDAVAVDTHIRNISLLKKELGIMN